MRKFFIPLFIILSLFSFIGNAQNNERNSLLWEVSGNGLNEPSYLFGTIHLICPDDYFWTPAMQKAFDQSNAVCFEADVNNPIEMMKLSKLMVMGDSATIEGMLDPKEFALLETFMKDEFKMNKIMYNKMKPFFLYSMMSMKAYDCKMPTGYEKELDNLRKKSDKKPLFLESLEFQLSMFDNFDQDSLLHQVVAMIKDDKSADSVKQLMQDMVRNYKNQDLDGLSKLVDQSQGFSESEMELLLTKRNYNWIPIMNEYMNSASVFFAVGAAHLNGKDGIIDLLKKEGYKVTPIK